MPSSRPNTIPTVVHLIRQLKPASILDVGVGFGKWGHLFREYTDILEAEREPGRYFRQNWRVRIDGIEAFADYITDMHRYIYNNLYIGEATKLLPSLPAYDIIFIGDVIEHLMKAQGFQLLAEALEKARRTVIVTTPRYETGQGPLCGNELERHRSLWKAKDFEKLGRAIVKTVDGATYLAVLLKPGVRRPVCRPPRHGRKIVSARLIETCKQLLDFIPASESFILVDEEQLRSQLGRPSALPFLEKYGEYWGPPDDDDAAIAEVERLRQGGAAYLAFVWSTFWWLDHYPRFRDYLLTRYPTVAQNENLIVFALAKAQD
jgi:hypothetical protein